MGTFLCGDYPQHEGCDPNSNMTMQQILSDLTTMQYNLILHIGDIAYADGVSWTWEQFHDGVQDISTLVPYMTCIGNHEYDFVGQPFSPKWGNYGDDSNGECGIPYGNRYLMPGATMDAPWYSIDFGMMHIVFLSSEHNFTAGSPQYNWVIEDLSSVNRSITPWLITISHRSMVYSGDDKILKDGNYNVSTHLRDTYDSVFYKFSVDISFGGHIHAYERTCPMFNFTCVQGGTTYVLMGMAGKTLDDQGWSANFTAPDWSIYRNQIDYGHTRFSVTNDLLKFEFVGNDGTILDQFNITKSSTKWKQFNYFDY